MNRGHDNNNDNTPTQAAEKIELTFIECPQLPGYWVFVF